MYECSSIFLIVEPSFSPYGLWTKLRIRSFHADSSRRKSGNYSCLFTETAISHHACSSGVCFTSKGMHSHCSKMVSADQTAQGGVDTGYDGLDS